MYGKSILNLSLMFFCNSFGPTCWFSFTHFFTSSVVFVCFEACRQGFLAGCRPYLAIDATFLTGRFKGQLVAACVTKELSSHKKRISGAFLNYTSILCSNIRMNTGGKDARSDSSDLRTRGGHHLHKPRMVNPKILKAEEFGQKMHDQVLQICGWKHQALSISGHWEI